MTFRFYQNFSPLSPFFRKVIKKRKKFLHHQKRILKTKLQILFFSFSLSRFIPLKLPNISSILPNFQIVLSFFFKIQNCYFSLSFFSQKNKNFSKFFFSFCVFQKKNLKNTKTNNKKNSTNKKQNLNNKIMKNKLDKNYNIFF